MLISSTQNWFQNRRAKVKHEAKRKPSNRDLHAQLQHQQHGAFIGHTFQPFMHQGSYDPRFQPQYQQQSGHWPITHMPNAPQPGPDEICDPQLDHQYNQDTSMLPYDLYYDHHVPTSQQPFDDSALSFLGLGGKLDPQSQNEFMNEFHPQDGNPMYPIQEEEDELIEVPSSQQMRREHTAHSSAAQTHKSAQEAVPVAEFEPLINDASWPLNDAAFSAMNPGIAGPQSWEQDANRQQQMQQQMQPFHAQSMGMVNLPYRAYGGMAQMEAFHSQPTSVYGNGMQMPNVPTIPSQGIMSFAERMEASSQKQDAKRKTDSPHEDENQTNKQTPSLRRCDSNISNVTSDIAMLGVHQPNGSEVKVESQQRPQAVTVTNGSNSIRRKNAPTPLSLPRTPSYNNSAAPSPSLRAVPGSEKLRHAKSASHLNGGGKIQKVVSKKGGPSPVSGTFSRSDMALAMRQSRSMSNIHASSSMRLDESRPDVPPLPSPAMFQQTFQVPSAEEEVVPASTQSFLSGTYSVPMTQSASHPGFQYPGGFIETPQDVFQTQAGTSWMDWQNSNDTVPSNVVQSQQQQQRQQQPQQQSHQQQFMSEMYMTMQPQQLMSHGQRGNQSNGLRESKSHGPDVIPPVGSMTTVWDSKTAGSKTPTSPKSWQFQPSYQPVEKVPDEHLPPRNRESSVRPGNFQFVDQSPSYSKLYMSSPTSASAQIQ